MCLLLVILVCVLGQATTLSISSCFLPAFPINGRYNAQIDRTKAPGDEVSRLTVLEYSCDLGYTISEQFSSCQGNDTWIPNPTCAKHCALYISYTVDYLCFSAENVRVSCQPAMPHGSYVHFNCKTGHTLFETQTLDEMVCRDGSWSVLTPKCKPECGLEIADGSTFIFNASIAVRDTLPWHVAVYQTSGPAAAIGFICGGTLISTRLVIGAAHCFYDAQNRRPISAQQFRVAANKHFRAWDHPNETHAPKSEVREIRLHEWYTGLLHQHQNDLALVVLETPFEFSQKVGAICFDLVSERSDSYQLSPGNVGKFTGWGVTEEERLAEELRVLRVPIVDHRTCLDEYLRYGSERYITADKVCAGYTNGSTGCNGDSGAGLVFPTLQNGQQIWWLRGVLSVGPRDGFRCRSNTYTAFTKLFALRNWLKRQINELSSQRELLKVPDAKTGDSQTEESGCILPARPANGRFTISDVDRTIPPGSRVDANTFITYSCNSNYDLSTSNVQVTCRKGNWTTKLPTCRERCKMVSSLTVDFKCKDRKNHDIPCTSFLTQGTKITSTCKPGHFNPTGVFQLLKCRSRGNWDHSVPECKLDCGLEKSFGIPLIAHGAVAKKDTFPWHVGIYYQQGENLECACMGSLIHSSIVITVAHCFWSPVKNQLHPNKDYKVAAGKFYRDWDHEKERESRTIQRSEVTRILIPEEYKGDERNQMYDLAIVQLTTPFSFSDSVSPVCYDLTDKQFNTIQTADGVLGKVAGWGVTDIDVPSQELRTLTLPVANSNQCRNEMNKYNFIRYLTADKMCAGYTNGSAICRGDSGTGFVVPSEDLTGQTRWYLRGVASIGPVGQPHNSHNSLKCSATYTAFTQIYKLGSWLLPRLSLLLEEEAAGF